MKVAVKTRDERVAEIRYLPPHTALVDPRSALAERAAQQLERYREDPDRALRPAAAHRGHALPAALVGCAVRDSRAARRCTYGELARRLGAEARAVGQACGDNRLPIVIPCHRVVAANGIGGFAHSTGGYLIEAKRWLLAHERSADALRARALNAADARLLDAFCDALWLEDGLSRNTISLLSRRPGPARQAEEACSRSARRTCSRSSPPARGAPRARRGWCRA